MNRTRFAPAVDIPDVATVAALLGDPGRASMMAALMDGRALTAKELACVAKVAPATASGHLAKLVHGQLLVVTARGRHRYFRLATPLVGQLLENLMAVASDETRLMRVPLRVEAVMREARTCYDHLAGRVGVAIADALVRDGHVILADGGGEVTPSGLDFLRQSLGLLIGEPPSHGRRTFCRPCLDWSERRFHLAGSVGAALCKHALERGWLRKLRDTRALAVTPAGRKALEDNFQVTFPRALSAPRVRPVPVKVEAHAAVQVRAR